MIMQFVLCQSSNQGMTQDYLEFNRMSYQLVDTWDPVLQMHRLPSLAAAKTCVICNYEIFGAFMADTEIHRTRDFLQHNHLLVTQDTDGFTCILEQPLQGRMQHLNSSSIPQHHVHLVLDAVATNFTFLSRFDRFDITTQRFNWFMKNPPRIERGRTDKKATSRDFLMTAINKISRPHRARLWHEMTKRSGLIDRGNVWFKSPHDPWVGDLPVLHDWRDGHASMDLYRHSWCEVVPETMCQHAHFVTEKTIKPLATETPFFVVSTAGYLEYLHTLGFRTFHGIIDESYDQCEDLDTRIRLMLDQLELVIKNGTPDFYHACRDVLRHNHDRVMQIAGSYQYHYDAMLTQVLERMVDQ